MLRKSVVSTAGKCPFLDAEYHVDAVRVNFNALDQGTDQLPPAQPIEFVQADFDFAAKFLQTADNGV